MNSFLFKDTAFMSSQSDFLSALAEYNGPNKTQAEGVNFLEIYLQTMKYFTEHHRNETWNPKLQDNPEMSMKYFKHIYEKQEVLASNMAVELWLRMPS